VPAVSAAAPPDPLDEVAATAPAPVALAPALVELLLEPLLEQPATSRAAATAGAAMTRAGRAHLFVLLIDPTLDRIDLSLEDVEAARTAAPRCDCVRCDGIPPARARWDVPGERVLGRRPECR
jgi:hypothetical protein